MRIAGENLKISVEGQIVNYDDNGPVYAPPVIFIHGTPFNKSIWDLQVEALKNNFRVISYDLRGHGGTRGEHEDLAIDTFTQDLIHFMDALEIEKAIICGLSLGGYVALDAVNKFPGRFNGLVLSGVQCMEDSEEIKSGREKAISTLLTHSIEKYADDLMRELFASTSFVTRKEEVRAVRRMIIDSKPASIVSTLAALSRRHESCSNLWSLQLPVLILAGKEDAITPVSVSRFMRDNINGSVLHEIEYAGHLANLENTHEFNMLLKAFIDKVCQKMQLSPHCVDATARRKAALSKD